MSNLSNSSPTSSGLIEVLSDLIQSTQLFPDENQTTYETLREMLFSDLTPGTPYEHVIAQNLVDLEWEAMRHRRFRDQLILSEYKNVAAELVDKSDNGQFFSLEPSENAKALAHELVSSDPEARTAAEQQLAERAITSSEILAKAYQIRTKDLEPHDRKLAEIEVRRRRLREDYEQLKASTAGPIEDAQILGIE
jgi:hypothetical protein